MDGQSRFGQSRSQPWKKGTFAVLLQSGLNESWWANSMECETYLRNVTDLLSDGKTPNERRFGQPFKGPIIPFGSLVEYHPITAKISPESINLERKFCLDCSSDTLSTRVEFGRVTYWSQTSRSWKRWTHRKSTRKDSMRKKWYFPKKGEVEVSLPQLHDLFPYAGEAINDFWSMSGNFIYRHHVEPRVKLYSPKKELFPIPLKYIDVTRTTHTTLEVKQEKRIDDYWNIDGSRDLSDPWTGFTQFTPLDEKAPDGEAHRW